MRRTAKAWEGFDLHRFPKPEPPATPASRPAGLDTEPRSEPLFQSAVHHLAGFRVSFCSQEHVAGRHRPGVDTATVRHCYGLSTRYNRNIQHIRKDRKIFPVRGRIAGIGARDLCTSISGSGRGEPARRNFGSASGGAGSGTSDIDDRRLPLNLFQADEGPLTCSGTPPRSYLGPVFRSLEIRVPEWPGPALAGAGRIWCTSATGRRRCSRRSRVP
jgi:hypothetical protein